MVILCKQAEPDQKHEKSFTNFGGSPSNNDQDIAERVFSESEAAAKTSDIGQINKALDGLERIAAQLTAVNAQSHQ